MRLRSLLAASAMLLGATSALADPPRIAKAFFEGNQAVLTFDQPMLTWVGSSATTITSDPALACQWFWQNDAQLICGTGYSGEPPHGATLYTLRIGGGLWSQQEEELAPTTQTVESSRPTLYSASVMRWNDDMPLIELNANVDVTADALREALRVQSDGSPLGYTLTLQKGRYTRDNHIWELTPSRPTTPDHLLTVQLAPGLASTEGPLRGLGTPILLTASIAESFHARRAACRSPFDRQPLPIDLDRDNAPNAKLSCPTGHDIVLEFSQPLSDASLQQLQHDLPKGWRLNKENAMVYLAARNENPPQRNQGYWLSLMADHPDQTFEWILPSSLANDHGAPLQREVRLQVRSDDYLPDLSTSTGAKLMPLGEAPPKLISTVNLAKLKFEQHVLADGAPSTSTDTERNGGRNDIRKLAPPSPPRDARDNGGLVEGTVGSDRGERPSRRVDYALNYAAFDITANYADTQFLVWVTDWNGAAPIAGAKVELLSATSQKDLETFATATTGADGTALFDADTFDRQRSFYALVRVSHGGKRAILPLNALLIVKQSSRENSVSSPIKEGDVAVWGISDKPLYRPGETVHYRVWVRERRANHLRRIAGHDFALTFKQRYNRAAVSEIQAHLDDFGSFAGELKLPAAMHDSDYCIDHDERWGDERGVCFRVTGYHVNDLWADVKADRTLVREGESFSVDATAGYYSGGPVVGAQAELSSLLTAQPVESAYPAFRAYTFVDVFDRTNGYGGESLPSLREKKLSTDAHGAVHQKIDTQRVPVDPSFGQRPIPFGKLEIGFAASTSGGSSAVSAPATLTFSQYARYVGLKIDAWVLPADADPTVDTIVISDDGKQQPPADIHIEIEDLSKQDGSDENAKPVIVASCTVRSGSPSPCPFHAPHAGSYRFRATSGDAAPAQLTRYVLGDSLQVREKDKLQSQLFAETTSVPVGTDAHLVLQQPFKHAQVLFTIEHGRVLKRWIERVDTPMAKFDVPMPAEWSPGVAVKAVALDAASAAFGAQASKDDLVSSASIDIDITGAPKPQPLLLTSDRATAKPGDDIVLTLHNPSSRASQVTLAVVDDAARALASEFSAQSDPAGERWLGGMSSWQTTSTAALGHWSRDGHPGSARYHPIFPSQPTTAPLYSAAVATQGQSLETIVVTGSNIPASSVFVRGAPKLNADIETASPVITVDRAALKGALRNVFVESAFWKTDLTLDANAGTTTRVHLPDNLTRWRVLAWSADADDAFALAQTTVEASLPIEVRADVPTRLFPGDLSDIRASVRNHDATTRAVGATLHVAGTGVNANATANKTLSANAHELITVTAHPDSTGEMRVEARAKSDVASDGVSAAVEVASPQLRQRLPVAGWLPDAGVQLALPPLAAGATDAHLVVRVGRGLLAMAHAWSDALRDYPHRCWEQVLSRAVGAAAVKKLGITADWKDTDTTVEEALRMSAQFQDDSGFMHFFPSNNGTFESHHSLYLTAYTLRQFAFLKSLGYAIPEQIGRRAREALGAGNHLPVGSMLDPRPNDIETIALLAAGIGTAPTQDFWEDLWQRRSRLPWSSRADLAVLLKTRSKDDTLQRQAVAELREAGRQLGLARVIASDDRGHFALGSHALDQCAVIRALQRLDVSPDATGVRDAYLRGLMDLYESGNGSLDTQASAMCLSMLIKQPQTPGDSAIAVVARADAASNTIALAPHADSAEWIAPSLPSHLELRAQPAENEIVSFVANIDYAIDGRHAQRAAVGFAIDREYRVLRNNDWKPVAKSAIREGDWVRVGLRFTTTSPRHMVAITDIVPGGLRPTDLELAGVADLDVKRLSFTGSAYFYEHQIDDRLARFYCEELPPGEHEIFYYTRATHRGHFAALPATAELMYGKTSVARTAAGAIDIGAAQPADSAARKASASGAK